MSISARPYIGSRDFYPDDMRFREWMFGVPRRICKTYGYGEYASPVLEPIELYTAKSSEEIVNEQLYRFTDRGDREVAIRPEMTPTLARMVAAKINSLTLPLRLYSIANFMRYERPGRGRLREFFQLNVDLLGSSSATADAEVMMIAVEILRSYGASDEHFMVRFSDRRLFDSFFSDLDRQTGRLVGRLLDKREKISSEEFDRALQEISTDPSLRDRIAEFISLRLEDLPPLAESGRLASDAVSHLLEVERLLADAVPKGVLSFDPGIVRGFDYYTGLIFEVYDNHPENNRALFGGGRYDRLLGIYGKQEVPAVGFGMGDVTLENFIRNHNLAPAEVAHPEGVYITLFSPELFGQGLRIASMLRQGGICAEVALEPTKKFGKQFEIAQKKGRRFALIVGEDEIAKGIVRVKDLQTGEQKDVVESELVSYLLPEDRIARK